MEEIVIKINWIYFLGILGSLIYMAWQASSRFTKLETDMTWVKDVVKKIDENTTKKIDDLSKDVNKKIDEISKDVNELRVSAENKKTPLFASQSPVRLTPNGEKVLNESGLKAYIDTHSDLINKCKDSKLSNAYEVQTFAFDLFDALDFDEEFDLRIKQYAYDHGISLDIIKRVGALYFRDLCLIDNGMPVTDIDKHNPDKVSDKSLK